MKLIIGLGNPGKQYERTRHNVGWWVVDHLADVWHLGGWREEGQALAASGRVDNIQVRLLKPLTFMNLSGKVLVPYLRRAFWSPVTDLLVVVDDVALPVGSYRLRAQGSAGGHNGLKSIEQTIGSRDYPRLRIGIRPLDPERPIGDLADFVLSPFASAEREEILSLMPRFTDAAERWLREGIVAAMNAHNGASTT
ncbi:MAG TPA: aminoacyl-tRNA hydrolase [Gemmatimonadaceae bacterium]|nr:aminoacyl-tRNA hydrolase [Gemmatimonadaceae bacterium]